MRGWRLGRKIRRWRGTPGTLRAAEEKTSHFGGRKEALVRVRHGKMWDELV